MFIIITRPCTDVLSLKILKEVQFFQRLHWEFMISIPLQLSAFFSIETGFRANGLRIENEKQGGRVQYFAVKYVQIIRVSPVAKSFSSVFVSNIVPASKK